MKAIFCTIIVLLFCVCQGQLFAQNTTTPAENKIDYIGTYNNNKIGGDTISGYIFLSVDSFKLIYTIDVNDGKDMLSPMATGTWVLKGKNIEFRCNNGKVINAKFGDGRATSGPLTDKINLIELGHRSYSNLFGGAKPKTTL